MATTTVYDLSGCSCCGSGPTHTVACDPNPMPDVVYATLTFSGGGVASVPLTYAGSDQWQWIGSAVLCSPDIELVDGTLSCIGSTWQMVFTYNTPHLGTTIQRQIGTVYYSSGLDPITVVSPAPSLYYTTQSPVAFFGAVCGTDDYTTSAIFVEITP